VERQKEVLKRELNSLEEQIDTLEEGLKVKPDYGMGQGDPAVTQWELDQAMLERLRNHAQELEQALQRLDQGTYGVCERCGKRINPDRLAVLPDTKICVSCAQKG
jgi:RNA polymerase-binding transcription factor DksA